MKARVGQGRFLPFLDYGQNTMSKRIGYYNSSTGRANTKKWRSLSVTRKLAYTGKKLKPMKPGIEQISLVHRNRAGQNDRKAHPKTATSIER
jgi:hypothetical protein